MPPLHVCLDPFYLVGTALIFIISYDRIELSIFKGLAQLPVFSLHDPPEQG